MRVLHPIGSNEVPVCRGAYHYLKDGQPTGHVEHWQITRLPTGGEIVRADVDGREAEGAPSLITHLQRYPDGRPEWLRLRYHSATVNAAAQYTFEPAAIRIARRAEGVERRLEMVEIAANYGVDYHPVIGHDYVWRSYPASAEGNALLVPIFSPDLWAEGISVLIGRALRFSILPSEAETCQTPAGVFEGARKFQVTLSDGVRSIAWYDDYGVPLRWTYPDKGYDFVLSAYIRGR